VRVAAITDRRIAANVRGLPIVSHILGVTTMRVRLLPLLFGLSLCGCATTQDYHYNLVQRYRASTAYHESYGLWAHCSRDYKDGWKQGYFDLSTGQCEEPPATPPHHYWNASFQSLEGRAAIDDWYSGWQDGATAAIEDGRPFFHPVVTSPTAPVNNRGPHPFHCGELEGQHPGHGGHEHEGLEAIPPVQPMATHDPQPQVHVGPVRQEFASDEDDELLDEATLPASASIPFSGPPAYESDEEDELIDEDASYE
jgi:hypothetical protein